MCVSYYVCDVLTVVIVRHNALNDNEIESYKIRELLHFILHSKKVSSKK